MVYNLCETKEYDFEIFDNNVVRFPIDEDPIPNFDDLDGIIKTMDEWFASHDLNIVAVHHNDNGIVGMIVTCYLLHAGQYKSSEGAIAHFNKVIGFNNADADDDYYDAEDELFNSLSRPSHIRFCGYYEKLCLLYNSGIALPKPRRCKIDKIFISKDCTRFKIMRIKCDQTAKYELNTKPSIMFLEVSSVPKHINH